MINHLAVINGKLPVKEKQSTANAQLTAKKEQSAIKDQLTGTEKSGEYKELRKVAREMESLFAFQLLKVMRDTTESMSSEKKGNGYNTYMSMFDTEIANVLSERGLGLQDSIMRWLERAPGVKKINNSGMQINNEND